MTKKLPDQKWINFRNSTGIRKEKIREEILLHYLPLATEAAGQYARFNLPKQSIMSYDDILSCAKIGLLKSIDSFDLSFQTDFKTHAYTRIRGEIIDELRRMQFCKRNVPKFRREVARVVEQFIQKFGRNPNIEDLREFNPYFDVNGAGLDKFTDKDLQSVLFGDIEIKDDYGRRISAISIAVDKNRLVVDKLKRIEIIDKLMKALPDELERRVIVLYFFGNKNISSISKELKIKPGIISNSLHSAILKLRKKTKNNEELIDVLQETT